MNSYGHGSSVHADSSESSNGSPVVQDPSSDIPEQVQRLSADKRNEGKCVNIHKNYAKEWGIKEGIRELVQNWRDGILQAFPILKPGDVKIEISQPKPNHIEIVALDASGISVNRGVLLDLEHLRIGKTTKKDEDDNDFAGGHGEGMKVGINALIRAGCSVLFFTNHHVWTWSHRNDELWVNFRKPTVQRDKARITDGQLHVVIQGPDCSSNAKESSEISESLEEYVFDQFLFIRAPGREEILCKDPNGIAFNTPGSVLLSDRYRRHLYVTGILVQKYEGGHGLHYGYNVPRFQINRDREVARLSLLSDRIHHIWSELLPSSEDAQKRYLDLFLMQETCLDITNAESFVDKKTAQYLANQLLRSYPGHWFCSRQDSKLEAAEMIIRNSLKLEPMRLPPQLWTILCRKHRIFWSARTERTSRFQGAPNSTRLVKSNVYASSVAYHTYALLSLAGETRDLRLIFKSPGEELDLDHVLQFNKNSDLPSTCFVHDKNLVASSIDHLGCLIYLSALELEGEHRNPECFCAALKLASLISEEVLGRTGRKDGDRCSLALLRSNLVNWIPNQLKVDIMWGDKGECLSNSYDIKLSWSGTLMLSSSMTFIVVVSEVLESNAVQASSGSMEEPLVSIHDDLSRGLDCSLDHHSSISDSNSEAIDYSPEILKKWALFDPDEVPKTGRNVIYSKTSEGFIDFKDFIPGKRYQMQVQADKDFVLDGKRMRAPASHPLYFFAPLTPPKNVSAKWEGSRLCFKWDEVTGARKYVLTIFTGEKEVSEQVTGASWSTALPWDPKTRPAMPDRMQICSIGGPGLDQCSERGSEIRIPKRLLPPKDVSLKWVTPRRMELNWTKVDGSETYQVRLYTENKCASMGIVDGSKWEGNCDLPLPFEIAVSSISSDGFESDESVHITAHSRRESGLVSVQSSTKSPTGGYQCPDGDLPEVDRLGLGPVEPSDRRCRASPQNSHSDLWLEQETPSSEDESDSGSEWDSEDEGESDDALPFEEDDKEETEKTSFKLVQAALVEGSKVLLKVGDFFNFRISKCRSKKPNPPNSDDGLDLPIYLGQVQEIRVSNSTTRKKTSFRILRYTYFRKYFGLGPIVLERYSDYEAILLYDDASVMGTIEDSQTIQESDISWVERTERQKLIYVDLDKNPTTDCFVCRLAASITKDIRTFVPVAKKLLSPTPCEEQTGSTDCDSSLLSLEVADFFCGAGGFSLGFRQAGFDILHGVDKNVHAMSTYTHNFSGAAQSIQSVGDFLHECRTNTKRIDCRPSVVLISTPCQGFSTANNGGKDDTENNQLVRSVGEILSHTKAPYLIYENVAGLLLKKHKSYLNELLVDLIHHHYSFTYKLMHCAEFGVASTRKRFIILGARRGFDLPDWPTPHIVDKGAYVTVKDVIQDLSVSRNKTTDTMGIVSVQLNQHTEYSKHAKALWDQAERTEDSEGSFTYRVFNHVTGRGVGKSWRSANPNLPLHTVRTKPNGRWNCMSWARRDILSVRELARIMSFPDEFHFLGSLEEQYRQIGNAVPPALAKAIAVSVRRRLEQYEPKFSETESTNDDSSTNVTVTTDTTSNTSATRAPRTTAGTKRKMTGEEDSSKPTSSSKEKRPRVV